MAGLLFAAVHRKGTPFESSFGSFSYSHESLMITGPSVPAEMGCGDLEFETVVASRSIQEVILIQVGSQAGSAP